MSTKVDRGGKKKSPRYLRGDPKIYIELICLLLS